MVPTKKCVSTLKRAGMSAEELEAVWLQRQIYPCGTYVAMAIQVEPRSQA